MCLCKSVCPLCAFRLRRGAQLSPDCSPQPLPFSLPERPRLGYLLSRNRSQRYRRTERDALLECLPHSPRQRPDLQVHRPDKLQISERTTGTGCVWYTLKTMMLCIKGLLFTCLYCLLGINTPSCSPLLLLHWCYPCDRYAPDLARHYEL